MAPPAPPPEFKLDHACERCGKCCCWDLMPHHLLDFATEGELLAIGQLVVEEGGGLLEATTAAGREEVMLQSPSDLAGDTPARALLRRATRCPFLVFHPPGRYPRASCLLFGSPARPAECRRWRCFNLLEDEPPVE
ncbi:MAG: hypothetical protein Kow0069_35230 [Promethearchaeota archaeon]